MSLRNVSRLTNLLQFPIQRQIKDGTNVIIDRLKEADIKDAYKVFMKYAAEGDGISKDEFKSIDDFQKKMFQESLSFYAKETKENKFVGIFNITPSGICRSTNPVMHAGYVILNPEMVNKGCGRELFAIYFFVGAALGFSGICGRTSATNSLSYLSLRRVGLEFTGYIPNSYLHGKLGWMDDCLFCMHTDCFDIWKKINKNLNTTLPTIPIRSEAHVSKDTWKLNNYKERVAYLPNGTQFQVNQADNNEDISFVENLIYEDAEEGMGCFALDEFNKDGTWNSRLLAHKATLVMKDVNTKEILGAAIIGPSRLARTSEPTIAGIYIIINPKYRRQKVATFLEIECAQLAKDEGFSLCATDIFTHNSAAIQFYQSRGFKIQGSVYNSGYFKNKGYVDTILLFRFCHKNPALQLFASSL